MKDIIYVSIVDDHTMFRKGLSVLINHFSRYQVIFDAANGKDFIRQLDKSPLPDIVLMDIAMPDMDGYITTTWITENHPQIKTLALSTMESEAAIIKMIRAGARGYLLKDDNPSDLKLAFDEIMSIGYYYNMLVSRDTIRSINLMPDSRTEEPTLAKLTSREITFLKLAFSEKTYSEIAKEMFVSERTIDGYRDSLFKKLGITSRVGLAIYAIKNGFVHI